MLQVLGSIYIPEVNYVMMVLTVVTIAIFKTTIQLGNAYGNPCNLIPSAVASLPRLTVVTADYMLLSFNALEYMPAVRVA